MARRANSSSAYRLDEIEPTMTLGRRESDKNKKLHHKQAKPVHQNEVAGRKLPGRLIGNVLLICVFAFVILFRYSAIVEKDHELGILKEQRNEILDQNKRIQVEIDSATNLENVEKIATTELGMSKPEKYQTVYVTIQGDDYVEVAEEIDHQPVEGKHFYATIIQTLGNVLEYLY